MDRRDVSKVLLGSVAGSVLVSKPASAQACIAPCYPRTAAEVAASVTPANYDYPELNVMRYGGDNTGHTDSSDAINKAVAVANAYPADSRDPDVHTSCTIRAPSGVWRINNTIAMPTRENTEMVFEGNIDVTQMAAGSTVFDFYGSSCQTLRFHELRDNGRRVDGIAIRYGVTNQIFFSRIVQCRYGITFISAGNGSHSKVENQFYYSLIGECAKGIYFQPPTHAPDACEGAQFWGGFVYASTEHGVLIGAGANANFGRITGAIDGFTSGFDFVNSAGTTSGWTLDLKFMQNPAYYRLGRKDNLVNAQVTGITMGGPDNGLFPALQVNQAVPADIPTAETGDACATFSAGDSQSGREQGILIANDTAFASPTAVALHAGYASGANASAASSAFLRAIHRNSSNTSLTLGAALYFTRRAGTNASDVFFKDSSGNTVAKLYAERNSVQLPVAKTPASRTASGEAGQICWDSNFLYVCVGPNTWKRAALLTW